MPADFTLKVTLPPFSGKGAAMLSSVMPGYHSGQRLASLKSAMVSCGEALIWTLRCTIAIVGSLLVLRRHVSVTAGKFGCRGRHDHRGNGDVRLVSLRRALPPGSRFQTVSK